jgi:hypothetical protein
MKKMLEIITCAVWLLLGAYTIWLITKAKTLHPLTLDDLALAWKLHKQKANCNASRIHDLLVRKNEVVGFKCNCGYEWLQKRPISQKVHNRSQRDKPLSLSEIDELIKERSSSRPDLGIRYLGIKKV